MKSTPLIATAVVIILAGGAWFLASRPPADTANTFVPPAPEETSTLPPGGMETGEIDTPLDASEPVTKEFTIQSNGFSFTPNTMAVKKGDRVKITFTNPAGTHDLKIDEFSAATPKLNAGESATIEFIADKTGSFEYYCSVGNHRAMGMWGTLTVE